MAVSLQTRFRYQAANRPPRRTPGRLPPTHGSGGAGSRTAAKPSLATSLQPACSLSRVHPQGQSSCLLEIRRQGFDIYYARLLRRRPVRDVYQCTARKSLRRTRWHPSSRITRRPSATVSNAFSPITGIAAKMPPLSYQFKVFTLGQKQRVSTAIKREMKRRAAVEPMIGHIKNYHRFSRNYLAGTRGHAINAIPPATGIN